MTSKLVFEPKGKIKERLEKLGCSVEVLDLTKPERLGIFNVLGLVKNLED